MKPSSEYSLFLLFLFLQFSFLQICMSADSKTVGQSVKDGETIISANGSFELGFFSPGYSKNRYVGIWYYRRYINVSTVVWVANREVPLADKLGVLRVIKPGIIVLLNGTGGIIWTSNTSRTVQNPVAQLLDSGNFVVKDVNDDNPESFLWQSFDYPTDTLLPSMKMGTNFLTGLEVFLSSWRSNDDPTPGDFTFHCDPTGFPQNVLKKGQIQIFRSRQQFVQPVTGLQSFTRGLVMNKAEVYYTYTSPLTISRLLLSTNGIVQWWNWDNQTKDWVIFHTGVSDNCDAYKLCGAYSICSIEKSPLCECMDKFVPTNTKSSNGCVRRTPLDCNKGTGFQKYSGLKLPDTKFSWFNRTMSLEECKVMCLKNCSCTAYANLESTSTGSSGCLIWFGDLVDIKKIPVGEDLYVRIASSDLDIAVSVPSQDGKKRKVLIFSILAGVVLLGLSLMLCIWRWGKRNKQAGKMGFSCMKNFNHKNHEEDLELPMFDLYTIMKATDNFAISNKLGEGGFGPVYKGRLEGGQEVAVKRLSKTSTQGLDELKNEIHCIAKLQHRNLVNIFGCCIQGEERMLIYEYMPNKSLDSFIFDKTHGEVLDWTKRFHIINGIARGLVYLHQDSRLRIIHRDLKASNILLDSSMTPKISDFGMAKIFAGNETGANTSRLAGTYGYLAPEYAVRGLFSVKSDVFSFGVLVLEIVSGERNSRFYYEDHNQNLLGHAWILARDGRSMELVDPNLPDSCNLTEVLRCIDVALLCVQQLPEDRPNMSSVLLMLSNEGALPIAKQPAFFTDTHGEVFLSIPNQSSTNDLTVTQLQGR
ncbi:hypothetical protein ACH5RR_027864 [Cinchona calisaya]|uniref:Receptor-like serine/threonine-protein kinase n=1 Tax=Cinchona calisaya TaxID=153742 RepID=A0ABD2YNB2_9GENT